MSQRPLAWKAPSARSDTPPVELWRLRLDDLPGDPLDTLRSLTVSSEHARARRYRVEADRHRHLAGRGLVRAACAHRSGCAPQTLSIVETPEGKPQLPPQNANIPPLEFNIAHTGTVILAVISRRQPVGVDVETLNRDVDADALTQRVCTEAERQWWTARPDSQKRDAFLRLWTCKEAFVKATGQGLRSGADTVECVFEEDRIIGLNTAPGPPPSSPSADQWTLRPLSVSSNLVGAVVRKGTLPSPLPCVDAAPLLERLSKT